jgi:hypothetical protein
MLVIRAASAALQTWPDRLQSSALLNRAQ